MKRMSPHTGGGMTQADFSDVFASSSSLGVISETRSAVCVFGLLIIVETPQVLAG